MLFNDILNIKNKNVLEIGCGAGRFTEHLVKNSKECVSIDLSAAIFFNVSKGNKTLTLIKADLNKLIPEKKFDVVICRGVLQHTPNPNKSIIKLFDFIDSNGQVFLIITKNQNWDVFIQNILFGEILFLKYLSMKHLKFF